MTDTTFCHSGNAGDIVLHCPAMIDIARRRGHDKFTLLLKLNVPASYSEPHPNGNVLLTESNARSLMTLLEVQPYIARVDLWRGEECIDMDLFRLNSSNLHGDISHWPCRNHLCTPDLSKPWIHVDASPAGGVLLGRTPRYRNPGLDFRGLVGVCSRHIGFESENDLNLPRVETPTVLDMARAIASCDCYFGNQSLGFALAQSMDVRRCLECCPWASNVQPSSARCVMVWNQEQLDEVIRSFVS